MQTSIASPKKADYYDDPQYDYRQFWAGRGYEHAAEEMAIKRLLAGKRFHHAADIGGGYGRLSGLLKRYADEVTLVDPSTKQLDLARDYLSGESGIRTGVMPADSLRFSDSSLDLVVMIRVMHHLPDPRPELAEIARVLAPDGYAIIEIANYMHGRNRLRHMARRKKMPAAVESKRTGREPADTTPFVNHNPHIIAHELERAGLHIERILSVSNLRSSGLKKLMPQRVLLAVEGVLQPALSRAYFGPSIFFLVKKDQK